MKGQKGTPTRDEPSEGCVAIRRSLGRTTSPRRRGSGRSKGVQSIELVGDSRSAGLNTVQESLVLRRDSTRGVLEGGNLSLKIGYIALQASDGSILTVLESGDRGREVRDFRHNRIEFVVELTELTREVVVDSPNLLMGWQEEVRHWRLFYHVTEDLNAQHGDKPVVSSSRDNRAPARPPEVQIRSQGGYEQNPKPISKVHACDHANLQNLCK